MFVFRRVRPSPQGGRATRSVGRGSAQGGAASTVAGAAPPPHARRRLAALSPGRSAWANCGDLPGRCEGLSGPEHRRPELPWCPDDSRGLVTLWEVAPDRRLSGRATILKCSVVDRTQGRLSVQIRHTMRIAIPTNLLVASCEARGSANSLPNTKDFQLIGQNSSRLRGLCLHPCVDASPVRPRIQKRRKRMQSLCRQWP